MGEELTIYDIGSGLTRAVTKRDVARWQACEAAFGRLQKMTQDLRDYQLSVVNECRSAAGMVPLADLPRLDPL